MFPALFASVCYSMVLMKGQKVGFRYSHIQFLNVRMLLFVLADFDSC